MLAGQRAQRRTRFDRAVARLRELGLSIDAELEQLTFHDEAALGRPTLARMLVHAGHAESVDDAFRRILSGGRPGYVPRDGVGPRAAVRAIRRAGGLASLAHFAEAPRRLDVLRELKEVGVGGLEVYYRGFGADTVAALEATSQGTRIHSHRGQRLPWRPRVLRRGARAALGSARDRDLDPRRHRKSDHAVIERPTTRALPVLDIPPPAARPAGREPRRAAARDDDAPWRVPPRRPGAAALPCLDARLPDEPQRLRRDGRPAARRRLRRGDAFEDADLILINTCAIREQAEQKVIGRQGYLARLKAERPGTRVVMTGCSVREADRAGLRRRYPAVDLFLRPDEEPELVDRLGLAGAQSTIGATTRVHGTTVGVADNLPDTRRGGRRR